MFYSLSRPFGRHARLILACAAILCLAESRVLAGCGDHGLFNFQSFEPAPSKPSTNRIVLAKVNTGASTPCSLCPQQRSMPGDAPCRGPQCSGDPMPQGMPLTSTKIHDTHDLWSLCMNLGAPDCDQDASWPHQGQSILPISRTDSIFHPPRPA